MQKYMYWYMLWTIINLINWKQIQTRQEFSMFESGVSKLIHGLDGMAGNQFSNPWWNWIFFFFFFGGKGKMFCCVYWGNKKSLTPSKHKNISLTRNNTYIKHTFPTNQYFHLKVEEFSSAFYTWGKINTLLQLFLFANPPLIPL